MLQNTGAKASEFLSKYLAYAIDKLSKDEIDNNKKIQDVVVELDKKFCNSKFGGQGSTIVFAIVKPLIEEDKKSNDNHGVDVNDNSNNTNKY